MANSGLVGKSFTLDENILKHLKKIYDAYKGSKNVEGYERLKNLLAGENKITYEQIKRIKNFFDNWSGKKNETPYILNGGDKMKSWIETTLNDGRDEAEGSKRGMHRIGMPNQYIDDHQKFNVKNDNHSKKLQQESIYEIEILNNLITEIKKNKSCLK
jgi:hypothetical protein